MLVTKYVPVQLTLEFFERRKSRWLLPAETVNWEVWHLELTVTEPQSEQGIGRKTGGRERERERGGGLYSLRERDNFPLSCRVASPSAQVD